MFQGFYDLTSNMITQNRNLNIISNNMTNVSTPGFKSDKLIQGTFRDELIYRYDRDGKTPVGVVSRVNTADERVTNYEEGGVLETTRKLDCALTGDGFFTIQGENGVVYSRNGSFNLDNQGCLTLQGVGRVLGYDGNPIRLTTDDVYVSRDGFIFSSDGQTYFGQLGIVDFADYSQLQKIDGGVFTGGGAQIPANAVVQNQMLEDSNVSMVEEMTSMMSSQRSLQGSAQLLRLYDQLIGRAVQLGSMS